jgi:hypothetical protein
MAVAEYTFAFFRDEPEPLFTQSLSFADDAEAIREGGELLRSQQELVRKPARSICVARGSGDEAEWLGAWDFDDGATRWSADS